MILALSLAVSGVIIVVRIMCSPTTGLLPDASEQSRFVEQRTNYDRHEAAMAAYVETPVSREDVTPSANNFSDGLGPTDLVWEQFPVTGSFVRMVVEDRASIEASVLFKNKDLNPGGRVLSVSSRALVDNYIMAAREDTQKMSGLARSVAAEEFSTLVSADRVRTVSMDEYRSRLSPDQLALHDKHRQIFIQGKRATMEKEGWPPDQIERHLAASEPAAYMPSVLFGASVFATKVENGLVKGATLEELPRARQAMELVDHRVLQMAADIVSVFVGCDCLSRVSGDGLLAGLADRLINPVKTGGGK